MLPGLGNDKAMKRPKNYIRELREAADLTREELAVKVGCGVTSITKLERGERKLHDVWIMRISDALECYPADLLDGGPERLKPRERALVDVFRGMGEDRQDSFYKGAVSVAQPVGRWRRKKETG
jgi:transcriptional regulator with XRE-family HTH domain